MGWARGRKQLPAAALRTADRCMLVLPPALNGPHQDARVVQSEARKASCTAQVAYLAVDQAGVGLALHGERDVLHHQSIGGACCLERGILQISRIAGAGGCARLQLRCGLR